MRVTYRFDEVSLTAKKRGKCSCGKPCVRTEKFSQTLNPFNKNDAGFPKTRSEILIELRADIAAWEKKPFEPGECRHPTREEH